MEDLDVCAGCHRQIRPGEEVVTAVETTHEQTFGGEPMETSEGPTMRFHVDHVPDDPTRYRVVRRGHQPGEVRWPGQ